MLSHHRPYAFLCFTYGSVSSGQILDHAAIAEEGLKESELRFRAFMDHWPANVFIKDKNFRYIYANASALAQLGMTLDEVFGVNIYDIHKQNNAVQLDAADREIAEGGAAVELQQSGVLESGEKASWKIIKFPIPMPTGETLIGSISMDTTEQTRARERIKASLEEKEILLEEIHHRVKNNMQIIASMARMQLRRTKDEGAKEELRENYRRIMAMASVYQLLYESESLSNIVLGEYIKRLLAGLSNMHAGRITIDHQIKAEEINLDLKKAIPCGIVLNELITNSLKHAFADNQKGLINIEARAVGDDVEILVEDNGQGLTEGADVRKDQSVGHSLVAGLVKRQLRGTWDVSSSESGTRHRIRFKKTE